MLAARLALDRFVKPARRTLDEVDRPTLARARPLRMRLPEGELQAYDWGTPSAPTLLLLHGWSSHAPRWSAFVEAALARKWRVLAFDAPAHGLSSGTHSSVPQFRRALDAVIAAHGPVRAAVAHSLGALALATRLADVETLPRLHAAVLVSLPRDVGYLLESWLDALDAAPGLRQRVQTAFQARFGIPPSAIDAAALLPAADCPVLLVHDAEDDVVPVSHAESLAPLLHEGALHITRGLGHSGLLRDAATVEAVMAFVAPAMDAGRG